MARKLKKLTAAEFENWIPVATALGRVVAALVGHNLSVKAIWPRLRNGLLRAGAENFAVEGRGGPAGGLIEMEAKRWQYISDLEDNYTFWRSGTIMIEVDTGQPGYGRHITVTYFGVKFEPVGFDRLMAAISPPKAEGPRGAPTPTPKQPNPGGRAKAEWREPLLVELAGQLHDLTLEPKILADLERAATDWLGKQGEYPGERTVRNVVTPLWARIKKEGKNPKG